MALDVAAWVMREPSINWSTLNLLDMIQLQKEMNDWQSLTDDALGNSENT